MGLHGKRAGPEPAPGAHREWRTSISRRSAGTARRLPVSGRSSGAATSWSRATPPVPPDAHHRRGPAGAGGTRLHPLRMEGRARGVLNVAARPGQRFDEDELRFLETLGHVVCVARRSGHLRAEKLRNQEARAMAAVGKAIEAPGPWVVSRRGGPLGPRDPRRRSGPGLPGRRPAHLIVAHATGLPHPECARARPWTWSPPTPTGCASPSRSARCSRWTTGPATAGSTPSWRGAGRSLRRSRSRSWPGSAPSGCSWWSGRRRAPGPRSRWTSARPWRPRPPWRSRTPGCTRRRGGPTTS
jgi:hypothetical protein